MKQAVISTATWILEHAAPSRPISVKYVKTAANNQAAFAKALRGVDIDEHELFIKVTRRLLDNAKVVKGLTTEDMEEIYENEPDIIGLESEHERKDEDAVVCSDFELHPQDLRVEDVYDLWGWLYDVIGAGKMREMSKVRLEVKFYE